MADVDVDDDLELADAVEAHWRDRRSPVRLPNALKKPTLQQVMDHERAVKRDALMVVALLVRKYGHCNEDGMYELDLDLRPLEGALQPQVAMTIDHLQASNIMRLRVSGD